MKTTPQADSAHFDGEHYNVRAYCSRLWHDGERPKGSYSIYQETTLKIEKPEGFAWQPQSLNPTIRHDISFQNVIPPPPPQNNWH